MKRLKIRHKVTAIGLAITLAVGFAAVTTISISEARPPKACSTKGMVTELKYFDTAARLGSREAMARLGYMYYLGRGAEKNIETAFVWLTLASLKGYKKAAEIAPLVMLKLTAEQLRSADRRIADITKVKLNRIWM